MERVIERTRDDTLDGLYPRVVQKMETILPPNNACLEYKIVEYVRVAIYQALINN